MSTTSLEKQLKEVDQKRGQFTSGALNFGDQSNNLLQEFMVSANRTNGGGIAGFDHEAFPLLSKDNSALDPNLLGGMPNQINRDKKNLSVRSDKSKRSAFSLGFSKNV